MTLLNKAEITQVLSDFADTVLQDPEYDADPYKLMVFEDIEGRLLTKDWYGPLGKIGSQFVEPIITEHFTGTTTDEVLHGQPHITYRMIAGIEHEGQMLVVYYDEVSRG